MAAIWRGSLHVPLLLLQSPETKLEGERQQAAFPMESCHLLAFQGSQCCCGVLWPHNLVLPLLLQACGFARCPLVWVDKDARQAVRLAIRWALAAVFSMLVVQISTPNMSKAWLLLAQLWTASPIRLLCCAPDATWQLSWAAVIFAQEQGTWLLHPPCIQDMPSSSGAVCRCCRLAQVDHVQELLAGWLGAPEVTWPAIQAAARQKHPQLMAK